MSEQRCLCHGLQYCKDAEITRLRADIENLHAENKRLRVDVKDENEALRNAALLAQSALTNMEHVYVGDDDDVGECASCHERSYRSHAPDCKRTLALLALALALHQ